MFKLTRKEEEPSVLDKVIHDLAEEMENGYSDELPKQAAAMKVLFEAKAIEPKQDRVSANTMAVIVGNLIGIAAILFFERKNVITSKSLSFIPKLHS